MATLRHGTRRKEKKSLSLILHSRSRTTIDDQDSGVDVKTIRPMTSRDAKFLQTLLRKHTQEPSYQVPELHSDDLPNNSYKPPPPPPSNMDSYSKKKPFLALTSLFGVRPAGSRKGSISSVSSAADSSSPPSDNIPAVPPLPSPRINAIVTGGEEPPETRPQSRTSSVPSSKAPSDMGTSKDTTATSPSTSNSQTTQSTSIASSTSRTDKLAVLAVSGPTKKRSPSRQSFEADRPPSAQGHNNNRASTSTSTTITLVPRNASSSSRRQVPSSPIRDSFSSESSSVRYRPVGLASANVKTMSVVDEEGRLMDAAIEEGTKEAKGRGREASASHCGRASASGASHSQGELSHSSHLHHRHHSQHSQSASTSRLRSTKHGSFDFERPGWWSSHAPAYQTPPHAVVHDVRRSVSMRGEARQSTAPSPSHERSGSNEVGGSLGRHSGRKVRRTAERPPDNADTAKKEKKSKRNSFRLGIEAGLAKLKGGFISHGPFPFEPPVPSSHAPNGTSRSPTPSGENRVRFERNGQSPISKPHQLHAATAPPTSYSNHLRPTRGKGRSLDLGIGLSWAPRTMREDRLLPGTSLNDFGSHNRTSRSKSPEPVTQEDEADKAQRMLVGKELSDVFRETLDERGYAVFKDCIRRFDAREITFDGPKGIIARVERLLSRRAPGLSSDGQAQLLGRFVRVILQNT